MLPTFQNLRLVADKRAQRKSSTELIKLKNELDKEWGAQPWCTCVVINVNTNLISVYVREDRLDGEQIGKLLERLINSNLPVQFKSVNSLRMEDLC